MFFIVLETIVQNIMNHGESETEMILNYQNIFYKIRILKVRALLTSLSIVFFLYLGIAVGYFYYLSP
jgi:hypothetical protein